MKIQLISREGIVVTAHKWQNNNRYFEVTHETHRHGEVWTDCRVLFRTLPIYNLHIVHKLLHKFFPEDDTYRKLIYWRAERLWKKGKRQLEREEN